MATKISQKIALVAILLTSLFSLPIVRCVDGDADLIPADVNQLNTWFDRQVGYSGPRPVSLIAPLAAAHGKPPTVLKVRADGSGDFKTINDAVKSVPDGNTNRIIISIGPGNYSEKIKVDRSKPFITFHGDPNNPPMLVFGGTAAEYGTVDSATLIVESDFFTAVNLIVVNSAPRPDGVRVGAQAVAMRISGDSASIYNCKFYGYQDTLCDHRGRHFFKDCYIEGTVDFIFGAAKSLYLNTEMHVIPGDAMAMITAQARSTKDQETGFVFVHCKVTGTGGIAYLGRSWFPSPRVVFAYSELSDAVNPEGWSDNKHPETDSTAYFGEYNNKGPGANLEKRVPFGKQLNDGDVKPFLSLAFVEGTNWLLPPPQL